MTHKRANFGSPANIEHVRFEIEADIDVDEYICLLESSGLAQRRPVHLPNLIAKTIASSNLLITARVDSDARTLIGICRCLLDYGLTCYCADLAVDPKFQRLGIAKSLLGLARKAAGPHSTLHLIAAPGAVSYYERIGMQRIDNAFLWPNADEGSRHLDNEQPKACRS